MSKKHISAIAALLFGATIVYAVPARRSPIEFADATGSMQTVRLYGDENFHYYVSEADGSLMMLSDGVLVPADIDASGRMMKSEAKVKASSRAARIDASASSVRRKVVPGLVAGTTFPAVGKQKAVVILVEYQDVKFNLPEPNDYFTRMLNQEGFSDYYATGSARDWFLASSGGRFEPEFEVYGPVTLQKNREYYGGNDAFGQDNAPQKMVIEGCRQLNADVDFTQYDRDGDGYIDNVFVVYAGRGEASGGTEDTVWPHAWTLNGAEPGQVYTFDGVRLNRYACCNEWELSDLGHGYRPVGIGTFVHEFSHVMGLPDLYSTSYVANSFTPGAWSALDYGPYNNDGCTPPQYSAWERASLGYMELKELPSKGNVAIEPVEQGTAYKIATDKEDEYFILENRQQSGWDAFIPGHGMLVWHIDYDAEVWRTNSVNNDPSHYYVDMLEADCTETNASRDGDSFPGVAGVTTLSDATTPALKAWSGRSVGVALTDITEVGKRVAVRVNGGADDIAAPIAMQPTQVKAGSFVAQWNPVDGAKAYILTVYYGEDVIRIVTTQRTSIPIDCLVPSTDYAYTVRADDGCFGSEPSERINVRTLDPTFDYFAPTSLNPAGVGKNYFVASWEPMDGATEYFLTVEKEFGGELMTVDCGFNDGLENLPEGWSTTSAATYGMASYSGASAPSLRLSRDGDELVMLTPASERVSALHFWHRGNGTGESETLTVYRKYNGAWSQVSTFAIETEKDGKAMEIALDPDNEIDRYSGIEGVKIVFNRPSKGAVAIDDVSLVFRGPVMTYVMDDYNMLPVGNVTSYRVENLSEKSYYRYTVHATDGEYTSLPSETVFVYTDDNSGDEEVVTASGAKVKLVGNTIMSEKEFAVYTIDGRLVAAGVTECTPAVAGLYIVVPAEGKAVKIIIN